MADYDVVVIGAGLGGLSAATLLARAGKKTLLLEKQDNPGGYATSFIRGRFEFEVSLHELTDVGSPDQRGLLWMFLNELGVAQKVEFISMPEVCRSVMPGIDLTLPKGRQNYEDTLCAAFPGSASGIKHFVSIMFNLEEEVMRAKMQGETPESLNLSAFPYIRDYRIRTLDEVLLSEVPEEKARGVLSQICGYLGLPPSRVSFLIYALTVVSRIKIGAVHIKGKSQALSQAFIDSFEEAGGEVGLNTGVTRIITDGNKVQGIVTEDGRQIACPYVVCNVNPFTTCYRLIGKENVPDWYLERLNSWSPGISISMVYLGLDCPCQDLGLNTHETFWGDNFQYGDLSKTSIDFDSGAAAVTCYSASNSEFSSPGTSVVKITLPSYGDAWIDLSPLRYGEAKSRIAKRAIEIAEKLAPGLRRHIEVLETATPLTLIRYTGNPSGSFTGFEESHEVGMTVIPTRGPLEGLYFSNAWVNMGGGFMPTILSGFMSSNDVLTDMAAGGRSAAVSEGLRDQMIAQKKRPAGTMEARLAKAREIIKALHPGRIQLSVKEIIIETASIRTLRLVPVEGSLPCFRAGQFINLFVTIDGMRTSRPYSLASAPGKPYWDITVRRLEEGFVSHYLHDGIKINDRLESSGPGGNFYYEPLIDSSEVVFLAEEMGITPFMSMIRLVSENKQPVHIHLLYGSRQASDRVYRDEMESIIRKHTFFKLDYVISELVAEGKEFTGFPEAGMISSYVGKVGGKTFFVCGPDRMCLRSEKALWFLGVPDRRIKKEVSGPFMNVSGEPGWPGLSPQTEFKVAEMRSGRTFPARAGEPLMIALERAGMVVPALCRSGECAVCRTKLVSGRVFTPERVHRRWADIKSNFIHPCQSYPLEDLQIRI